MVASSAAVYGDTQGTPAEESRPASPVSPYGFHKFMMEQLCREYSQVFGLETAVLRMFSVYGEGLRKQLLWDCGVKLMADTDSIGLGGTGDELRDWIHIDDAVAMIRHIAPLASVQCPIFNGGSGVAVKVRDIVALLSQSLQRPKRVRFSGISRRGDPIVLVADTARISSTGISCRIPMNSGMQRYADWFKLARNRIMKTNRTFRLPADGVWTGGVNYLETVCRAPCSRAFRPGLRTRRVLQFRRRSQAAGALRISARNPPRLRPGDRARAARRPRGGVGAWTQ